MKISFPTFGLVVALVLGGIIAGRYVYFLPRFIQGEKTPEIESVLMDGSPFRLSSLKGKYVLLDFWGSWCGPCRAQNAGLRELYSQFGDRAFTDASGFEIVSVAVGKRLSSRTGWSGKHTFWTKVKACGFSAAPWPRPIKCANCQPPSS